MKKNTLTNCAISSVLALGLFLSLSSSAQVITAEPTEDPSHTDTNDYQQYEVFEQLEKSDSPFERVKASDSIIPLEDGGFLVGTGEVEIFAIDDLKNPISVIDLDSNDYAVTKDEAERIFENGISVDTSIPLDIDNSLSPQ